MLTHKVTERGAAGAWLHRPCDPLLLGQAPGHGDLASFGPGGKIDPQMEAFLTSLRTLTGATDIVLGVQAEDAAPRSHAFGPSGLSENACRLIIESGSDAAPAPGGAMWIDGLADGRAWQILRFPVLSRRGRSSAVVGLVFAEANSKRRQALEEQLSALRPMIDAYLKLWQRSRAQSRRTDALHCALDSIDIGIVAIDRNARIVFANDAGTEHLASGEHLRRNGDGLSAVELRDALPLQVALSHALAPSHGSDAAATRRRAPIVALRSLRTERSILLSFIPAEGGCAGECEAAAILCILDPRLDTVRQLQPVCRLYGLSPVETGLVCHIANGQSLLEAAVALRIKEKTARGYLQQIFAKTGCKRQADLVRLMLCSLLRTRRDVEPAFLE